MTVTDRIEVNPRVILGKPVIIHPADSIPDGLLRVSFGLEHADDLTADLQQALG
jgi:Cys/Met metabolism PLP-dependent enzyme